MYKVDGIEKYLNNELKTRIRFHKITNMTIEVEDGILRVYAWNDSELIENLIIITSLKFLELEHLTYDEIKDIREYLSWFNILVEEKYLKIKEERTTKNND